MLQVSCKRAPDGVSAFLQLRAAAYNVIASYTAVLLPHSGGSNSVV